jgi:hypothetical protein
LKEAARKAHSAGLVYPRSGAKVPVSTIHTILRNRLYTGWFEWRLVVAAAATDTGDVEGGTLPELASREPRSATQVLR